MISNKQLLNEIKRLEGEIGRPPKKYEMDEMGKYSGTTYTSRFGSWSAALKNCGLSKPKSKKQIPNKKLLEHLEELREGKKQQTKDFGSGNPFS